LIHFIRQYFRVLGHTLAHTLFERVFSSPRIAPGRKQPDPARIPEIPYKFQAISPRL